MPESKPSPELSVLIVSYHSQSDLAQCLPSLYAQSYTDFEVVLVDNAPHDGTGKWLEATYPDVSVISNADNTGYAGGNNLGLDHVRGQWVLFLNPDTKLHEGALEQLVRTTKANPKALVNSKLLNPDGTVNASGLVMHYTGISTCRGLNEASSEYTGLEPVPLLSGAAFATSREVLADIGGFQASYFMYLEDIELSLRAKLCGYDILCDNDAIITHDYVQNLTARKFYYLERNRLLTLLIIAQQTTLWKMSPALLLTEAATWSYAALKGLPYLYARWRALLWFVHHPEGWRPLRAAMQAKRRHRDNVWLQDALVGLPFEQLMDSEALAGTLDSLTWPVYKFLRPHRSSSQAPQAPRPSSSSS
ncbi:MAG: glycosyltransferase family 2 protein [Deinococcota bacterium]